MKVTVGIKALNEAARIEASLASALAAVRPFAGEVVLADSGSSDGTIEKARALPVRIVQLANPAERSCGAGAQLAFQHARGEYFYLLDGDMTLDPDFLEAGIAFLEANPDVAGVGGHVNECNTEAEEFEIRAATLNKDGHWRPGIVDRLDCGGLYRTAAVRAAGYFADRNLHAFEEFDLGARLQSRGWMLARIDHPAVNHYGHVNGGYRLLWRRIRTGYAGGAGEVLRAALGQPHLPLVLRRLAHVRHAIAVIAWWAALLVSLFAARWLLIPLIAIPPVFLSWRRKSIRLGLYSFANWNLLALGFVLGMARRRSSPLAPLASHDLTPAGVAPAAASDGG